MSETPYNPDDPAFLLSRSLDEELSAAERARLDQAMGSSASLRGQADRLRRLDGWLKRWGEYPVELDWKHHAALTRSRVESDADAEQLEEVDGLLERWANRDVSIDEASFTAAVMAGVHKERRTRSWHGVVFRLGVPLAAAAAVVLAVTGTLRFGRGQETRTTILIGPALAAVTPSDSEVGGGGAVIVLGEDPDSREVARPSSRPRSSGVSFLAIGSSRVRVGAAVVPP
ncbi:MAG: hypothetical protein PVI86_05115 [Phycisphaerae bacterium]|jgi:hypothetical protein